MTFYKKKFNLPNGLADTSKLPSGQHKVQILDPAVGTGTFISATIRSIYERLKKQGQEGRWPAYVHNDLLPRLHGFELMMAPYTIAHLKLSLAFKQTVPEIAWNFYIGGYQPAQKWLKDRKGRQLTNEDIEHYQKIIVVLTETDRIMKEIDKIIEL